MEKQGALLRVTEQDLVDGTVLYDPATQQVGFSNGTRGESFYYGGFCWSTDHARNMAGFLLESTTRRHNLERLNAHLQNLGKVEREEK